MPVSDDTVHSYDVGKRPYKHDRQRSQWYSTNDFAFACIGHSFGIRNFYLLAACLRLQGSVILILPYCLTLMLFVIPIFFIQSFIGQFSSTGYISAFRVSPLFKGVGYVILLFNFTSVTYFSSTVAYPLLLLLKSFASEQPWMTCGNTWNTPNCTQPVNNTFDQISRFLSTSPTKEFFEREVVQISDRSNPYEISWPIVGAMFITWSLVGACLMNGIVTIGRILRYLTITTLTLLTILFIRVLFLPRSLDHFTNFLTPDLTKINTVDMWHIFAMSPILGTLSLGTGWGSVMTLASYNRFRTDIEKHSFLIPCRMSLVIFICGLMMYLIGEYMRERNIFDIFAYSEYMYEFLWIGLAYFTGTLEASQLWFALIYLMLFLCEFSSVVIQTLSITTAIYDEYENLRPYKRYISSGMCGVLFLLSTFFSTNIGVKLYDSLTVSGIFTQTLICLTEIVMLMWVYGRKRFLRDVQFVLGRVFPTWKFHIIRLITPVCVVFISLAFFTMAFYRLRAFPLGTILALTIKLTPWAVIPGYAVYKLMTTTGHIKERFRKCIEPNDWYPRSSQDRQLYFEALGSTDISHQLVEMDRYGSQTI